MGTAIIELRDVRKVYYKDRLEVPVLDGLNLSIAQGEFAALMGPSGSGKTTILNLVGGLDSATSGSVVVAGQELTGLSESNLTQWRSRNVGFIFQQYHLVPVLTALQNVELPLLLFKMSRSERAERARTALDVVGLGDRLDHRPNQLSGGQEQRVAIARAVVTDPAILLADEPTGDLDAKSAEEIMGLLDHMNKQMGKTIVMVTHDPKAAAHATHTFHLEKGVLVAGGAGAPAPARA
jgi:putative ABC transport system ATP-binding protein